MNDEDGESLSSAKQWRGDEARRILRSDVFAGALDTLKEIYIRQWQIARTVEVREDAHRYVTLIAKLKDDLESMATTGELEKKRLEALSGGTRHGTFLTWRTK